MGRLATDCRNPGWRPTATETMPTEWTTHVESVGTAISTDHDLDGSLSSVRIQLDSFRCRDWTEDKDEIEERTGKSVSNMPYDDDTDAYIEYGEGAHATIKFDVSGDEAIFGSIKPEDGDRLEKRHFRLLVPATRLCQSLSEVEWCPSPFDEINKVWQDESAPVIERLEE